MRNFDATGANEAALLCYDCGRVIVDGNWFARVKLGHRRIAMCCPTCVVRYLEHPERSAGANVAPGFNGEPEDLAAYRWRPAEATRADWDRASQNRPMTTAAVRLANT